MDIGLGTIMHVLSIPSTPPSCDHSSPPPPPPPPPPGLHYTGRLGAPVVNLGFTKPSRPPGGIVGQKGGERGGEGGGGGGGG